MNPEKIPNLGQDFVEEKYPNTKKLRKPLEQRFEEIEQNSDRLRRFEDYIINSFILDLEDQDLLLKLAKALYESEKQTYIKQGRGGDIQQLEMSDTEIIERYKKAIFEKQEIQKNTLKTWIEYIKQNDAMYPMWFRYYVIRSLKSLGKFSRDDKDYKNRTLDTIAPFPELNAEALGFVYKSLTHEFQKDNFDPQVEGISLTEQEQEDIASKVSDESKLEFALKGRLRNKRAEARKEAKEEFGTQKDTEFLEGLSFEENQKEILSEELLSRLKTKDFRKLYAFAQVECAGNLDRESFKGEWVKYNQGSDPIILEKALQGKGTGWCTAEGSAPGHLQGGDFYVFYTKNKYGEYTEPRIAIRMEGEQIGEIRGINDRQELEPELVDTAKEKYQNLPGAQKYEKASHDMKLMTEIYEKSVLINKNTKEKTYTNPPLTKSELEFLYELNSTIEGFGYQKDPRIKEIRNKRNKTEDALIIFECTREQIATNASEVNENTKAYIGPLYPNIFKELPNNIEHIYTTFPEGRIVLKEIQLPTQEKTPQEYEQEIEAQGMKVDSYAKDILSKANLKERLGEKIKIAIISNKSLGFPNGATRQESQDKAKELGIGSKLLPPLIGPELRKQYMDQPMGEYILVDMESITDHGGNPRVFSVPRLSAEAWLDAFIGRSDYRWDGSHRWAFLAS